MNRAFLLSLALASSLVATAGARAAEEPAAVVAETDESVEAVEPEEEGWTPAVNVSLNIFNFVGDGEVVSPVGQSNSSSGLSTIGEIRIGLDVASPPVDLRFAKPRLVGFAGIQVGPSHTVPMAKIGQFINNQPVPAGIFDVATDFDNFGIPYPNGSALPGQGSLVEGRYQGFGWYTGMGLDFGMPSFEHLLRVRPYLLYLGEQYAASGRLVSVTGNGTVIGTFPNITPDYISHFAQTSLAEEDFHYLGPGIELDLIATRGDRLEIVLFTACDFLFNVGDGRIDMRAGTTNIGQTVIHTPPLPPSTSPPPVVTFFPNAVPSSLTTYAFTTAEFRYNLQFGIRFGWRNLF